MIFFLNRPPKSFFCPNVFRDRMSNKLMIRITISKLIKKLIYNRSTFTLLLFVNWPIKLYRNIYIIPLFYLYSIFYLCIYLSMSNSMYFCAYKMYVNVEVKAWQIFFNCKFDYLAHSLLAHDQQFCKQFCLQIYSWGPNPCNFFLQNANSIGLTIAFWRVIYLWF